MPTYYDETLEDRYSRENQEHLSVLAQMKPEQIQHMEISLHNALSDADMLRKDAERYRWLRDGNNDENSEATRIAMHYYGGEWDEMIDIAMSEESK